MMRIGTARRAWLGVAVLLGLLGSAPRARAVVSVYVGSATGVPGGTATFQVVMTTTGEQVAGVGNTITFNSLTPIASCAINPLLFPAWSLEPQGCTPLVNCTHANFISLGQQLGGPIPNGTTLYACTVSVASDADVISYPLTCSNASAGDLAHGTLQVQCSDGQVQVVPVLVAHALQGATTLTLTSPAPTSPAFDGFPNPGKIIQIGSTVTSIGCSLGSDHTMLALSSPLPLNVADGTEIIVVASASAPKGGGGGGGCQIAAIGQSYTGLLLMMPAVLLWQRRRRSCR
jgi:hypothetical protein